MVIPWYDKKKEELITNILNLEIKMFISVPVDQPYSCQQNPEGLGLHREPQFSIWAEDTLQSYLEDLSQAEKEGLNLMTIKYARMENLIPRENNNSLIEEIVALQVRWQQEIIKTYPYLMTGGRRLSTSDDSAYHTSFETYLRSELETYSDNTLALLHRDMLALLKEGINGSERVYEKLAKKFGYESIEAAEQARKGN